MPAAPRFKYTWRTYQKRVLDKLDHYREDGSVHIVAPPGAGKTVLGLEVVRRMDRPTLILAPSLTIRAQWAQRFVDDFGADPNTISNDLYEPAATTIVTYQAMFEYHKRNGLASLKWIKLLVVDECHHLRNEWWKVLNALRNEHKLELLALTATPPYDVSGREWRRYHDFCGEIDEEISIPELVASGDLCPHQDYLYPVLPPASEASAVTVWQRQKQDLLASFYERTGMAYFLQTHPWLADPEAHYKDIFDEPEYFTALLSVLKAQGSEPPASALGILHGEATLAPDLDDHWATIFLQHALRSDAYFKSEQGKALIRPFRRRLTTMAAWHKGKLRLDHDLPPGKPTDLHAADAARAKLEALVEIARVESEDLGADLRMVYLTDFIYAELLPTTEFDRTQLTRVGTVPVFEALRRRAGTIYEGDLCVLSGSLVVIPETAKSRLLEMAYDELPTNRVIRTEPLFPDSKYLKVNTGGLAHRFTVGWVTRLFEEGLIRIIVGTKSLLGEGWDAPVINTLVLANEVGSFVLSNQMRGRAIRTVKGQPGKTANIWHPVVVHPGMRGGGPDIRKMKRRMKAFPGPRHDGKPVIQNGLGRFNVEFDHPSAAEVSEARRRNLQLAGNREQLIDKWNKALAGGNQLVEAIRPPKGRYYERKDPLTVHYRESIDRYFEADYRKLLLQLKVGTVVGALIATVGWLFFGAAVSFSVAGVIALAGLVMAAVVVTGIRPRAARARELRLSERRTLAQGKELNLLPYIINPVIISIAAGLFTPIAFGLFWLAAAAYVGGHLIFQPPVKMETAARRFEILSDTGVRLKTYGAPLVEVLYREGHFHGASPADLRLEEDGEEMFLYLDGAEHHDAHLFANALTELMSPIENPRYLLQLALPDDWTKGEYSLAVPAILGNKQGATILAEALSESIGERFLPVYTREPAGRLDLLTARLQATEKLAAAAERDMLWK